MPTIVSATKQNSRKLRNCPALPYTRRCRPLLAQHAGTVHVRTWLISTISANSSYRQICFACSLHLRRSSPKGLDNTLLLFEFSLRMTSRHHCILGLALLLQLNLCATLIVQRSIGGDLFQNLASEADYCHQRGAVCSTTRLEELDPTCITSIVPGDLCPTCACSLNWRYNNTSDTCIQGTCTLTAYIHVCSKPCFKLPYCRGTSYSFIILTDVCLINQQIPYPAQTMQASHTSLAGTKFLLLHSKSCLSMQPFHAQEW